MKLLSAGSLVEPGWWEKLAQHKLATPVESALVATETLDAIWLARDVDQMLATEPVVMALMNRTGDPHAWKATIGRLYAPQPLLFRLTVMRAQKTEMYQHALRLAVIAHAIGIEMLRSSQELSDLFLTALCHDLGEMHTDPSILTDGQAVTGKDLRFIHVHPITGYVILRQISGIPPTSPRLSCNTMSGLMEVVIHTAYPARRFTSLPVFYRWPSCSMQWRAGVVLNDLKSS